MKSKILNSLLIITSFFGYLEWSGNSHSFLFQAEGALLSKLFTNPISAIHPFTILPLLAQLLLLFNLFQKKTSKYLTHIGITGLGILLGFMFIIGLLSINFKIVISTIPFLITSSVTIRHFKKQYEADIKK